MSSKHYKHLFFDLDKTLWDLKTNSYDTLQDIYKKHMQPLFNGNNFDQFLKIYDIHNNKLWDSYRKGTVKKEELRIERFKLTLSEFGIQDEVLADKMADDYINISPLKTKLFSFTIETLGFLCTRYKLHIITNGFKEVQYPKLRHTGLLQYFTEIFISEEIGHFKPDMNIFIYSLKKAGAIASESLMIGDDPEVDILGAKAVGIDQVLFDPEKENQQTEATYYITSLAELKNILG